jgi:hypothetical protein
VPYRLIISVKVVIILSEYPAIGGRFPVARLLYCEM